MQRFRSFSRASGTGRVTTQAETLDGRSSPGRAGPPAAASRWGFRVVLLALAVGVVLSVVAAVSVGPIGVPPSVVWRSVWAHLLDRAGSGDWPATQDTIVWEVRLPRVLLSVVVGAGLSVAGVVFQALVRNALADPYILGASSGASVGAAAVLLLGVLSSLGAYALAGGAFAGAAAAVTLVFLAAQDRGRVSPLRLVLCGVAVAGVCSSLTSLIVITDDDIDAARAVMSWTLGSLASARWDLLGLPSAVVVIGTLWLLLRARRLNSLSLGDETARTLGVDLRRFRAELIVVASLVTGAVVAVSGAIGFVGLMVPHMVRLVVGADHRRLLPVAALGGAIYLAWVDVAARTLLQPREIPIGVLTALLGGPFFVALIRRRGGDGATMR
ncbi:FecCD family ABC transporter permease [Pseudonocardia hispaniensis]|uniref:FecCD family ABC transporter permease n=1 Tax=Pseudonocardia hispaniensis TaxID=904933 RepID=A0ABW1IXQ7_9PSEU